MSAGRSIVAALALLLGDPRSLALTAHSSDSARLASPAQSGRVRVTVTTASDAVNGDTSAVAALIASPGSDGLSLREAILATNNDPGRHAIRFAPSLDGAVIQVGAATGLDLPPLLAGGVSIDGDIDNDDRPDVTLRGGFQRPYPAYCRQAEFLCPAFRIVSSGNALRDLNLRTFAIGVLFTPASDALAGSPIETHHTYADNVIAGLVMSDIVWAGITFNWDRCVPPCPSFNTWRDTIIRNNSIATSRYGINLGLGGSIGDRIERFAVEGNTIRIARSDEEERIGIIFEAGAGVRNRITDLTISGNTIRGDLHRGVRISSGALGGDANTIQGVRITDNVVDRSPRVQPRDRADGPWCGHCFGIDLMLGEGSWLFDRDLRPIQYADGNRISDVEISGNILTGPLRRGVTIQPGGNGSSHNTVSGVRIHGNTIRVDGLVEGVHIDAGDCYECPDERRTSGNRVSDVSIAANDITIVGKGRRTEYFDRGGITLVGGTSGAHANTISGVSITDNRIETELIGIGLLGASRGEGNTIHDVQIRANEIGRVPLPIRHVASEVKGITVTGGSAGATNNRVGCVLVTENVVAGAANDLSVLGNVELEFPGGPEQARGNTASTNFGTLREAVTNSPDVFVGTVSSTTRSGRWATVTVEEVWRADHLTAPLRFVLPETVEVRSSPRKTRCQFMRTASGNRVFRVGQRYVFVPYDQSDNTSFSDDGWTLTTEFDQSVERLRPAGVADLIDAAPGGRAANTGAGEGGERLGLIVGASVILALGLLLIARRVRKRRISPV